MAEGAAEEGVLAGPELGPVHGADKGHEGEEREQTQQGHLRHACASSFDPSCSVQEMPYTQREMS